MPPEYVPDRQDEPDDAEHRYAQHERRAARRREREEAEEEAERCGERPRRD
jgi:hypothetical protein